MLTLPNGEHSSLLCMLPPHTLTRQNRRTTIPLFLQGRYQQSTGQIACLTCTAVRLSPSDAPRFVVCAALTATSNPNPQTPGQVQSEHRQHIYQCLPELRGGAYLRICTSCVASLATPLTTALQTSLYPPPPGTLLPARHLLLGHPQLRPRQLLPLWLVLPPALPPPGAPLWRVGRPSGAGPRLSGGDGGLPQPLLLELLQWRWHAQPVLVSERGDRGGYSFQTMQASVKCNIMQCIE